MCKLDGCNFLSESCPRLAIGHVRYINIQAWLRGFRVKIANFSSFFCPIPKRDIRYKENNTKYRSLTWKPWCHVRILMYRTLDYKLDQECRWTEGRRLNCTSNRMSGLRARLLGSKSRFDGLGCLLHTTLRITEALWREATFRTSCYSRTFNNSHFSTVALFCRGGRSTFFTHLISI